MTTLQKAGADLEDFDLRPDPRILPMLGEINIDQWRCIAELVDNAVDGFLNGIRSGAPMEAPRVDVTLPQTDKEGAHLEILDNGIGMTAETLQMAVRAGYSGNNPIDNLGLFGMGFNIATARLGTVTEVWTTKSDDPVWHGLVIDFEELRRQRHFRTAHLTKPKVDVKQHGTKVTIKNLKPEQRKWLAKTANQTLVRKRLAQAYSSMLRKNGQPMSFDLLVNNKRIEGSRHCVWSEERQANSPDGPVHVVQQIYHEMPDRPYCTHCMSWVGKVDTTEPCPLCTSQGTVVRRKRKVSGWIGLQRFKHQSEFGFDFIRNGRKIEIANKDLFDWTGENGEEREYPIDDPRNEGRIVGEIHIDHCRVNYQKERFDRADPAWEEMVALVRGEGPLRPEKAKQLGFSNNESPLFKLFKMFRRTSPQSKTAGAYARLLIVKDNSRALEMANSFYDGVPEYQDDTKWWELVEEADRELLYGPSGKPKTSDDGPKGLPSGLLDDVTKVPPVAPSVVPIPDKEPIRREVPSLSRKYVYSKANLNWLVTAYEVGADDPDVPEGMPWALQMADVATRHYHYLYKPSHDVFRSITLTPRDGLLFQLAWASADALRTSREAANPAEILVGLRAEYGEETLLDLKNLGADARGLLADIAKAFVENCPKDERASLFNELHVNEQGAVMRALAAKKIKPTEVTDNGSFLQYAPAEILRSQVERHPEYCFDNKIWDEPHASLDYGDSELTHAVRAGVVSRYVSLINDAIWLARQDGADLASASRDELVRATMSLRLLRPDVEPD